MKAQETWGDRSPLRIDSVIVPEYLTLEELSRYCGVSVSTLHNWKRSGMPYYKLGRSVRVKRSEFDAWITKFQVTGAESKDLRRIMQEVLKEVHQ